jgi:hypothetical protein
MANRWLQHLAQYRKVNKDMKPKELMKNARKSYQSGGGVFKSIGNTVKTATHDVKSSVNKLKGGGVFKSIGNTVKTATHDVKSSVNKLKGGGVFKSIGNTVKTATHDVKSSVNKLKGGGGDSNMPTPYVKSQMGSPVQGAMDVIDMRGGGVVPYETTGTDSTPAKVGGRRSRRQSSRKSRRTRRR